MPFKSKFAQKKNCNKFQELKLKPTSACCLVWGSADYHTKDKAGWKTFCKNESKLNLIQILSFGDLFFRLPLPHTDSKSLIYHFLVFY